MKHAHSKTLRICGLVVPLVALMSAMPATQQAPQPGVPGTPPPPGVMDADIRAVAALPGEPRVLSAGGVTRSEMELLTIENPTAFDELTKRRIVIVGGLDGDERGARAALGAVRWFKQAAPANLRQRWSVSVLPFADPEGHSRAKAFVFPPEKGYFEDAEQPESRYAWRWSAFQAPDLVLTIRGGDQVAWQAPEGFAGLTVGAPTAGSLAAAFKDEHASGLGSVPAIDVTARAEDGPQVMQKVLAAAARLGRSPLHAAIDQRMTRDPIAIGRLMAQRYPGTPATTLPYVSAFTWVNALRLASLTGDESLRAKVHDQTQTWVSGERKIFGDRIQLTGTAGAMILAELATLDNNEKARSIALEGAALTAKEKAPALPQYGSGWTDDMFMAGSVLSRVGAWPDRGRDLDTLATFLLDYSKRLQHADGLFVHSPDAPHAWGRGNGFAALGLIEALTVMPAQHPARAQLLEIYRRQMAGLKTMQAPDGMFRQIIDQPGSYREESATAVLLSVMSRGMRLGLIDKSYMPVVQRAWRGVLAHVVEDGTFVDVCTGTGAGPTRRYYYDRQALAGADDRGGALTLFAAVEMLELSRAKLP